MIKLNIFEKIVASQQQNSESEDGAIASSNGKEEPLPKTLAILKNLLETERFYKRIVQFKFAKKAYSLFEETTKFHVASLKQKDISNYL